HCIPRCLPALFVRFFLSRLRPPPRSPLFPYTTLFRSIDAGAQPAAQSLYLVAPVGRDATATALDEGLDPTRTLAVDCLFASGRRSEEHTSELQSRVDLVCRLLLEKKKNST